MADRFSQRSRRTSAGAITSRTPSGRSPRCRGKNPHHRCRSFTRLDDGSRCEEARESKAIRRIAVASAPIWTRSPSRQMTRNLPRVSGSTRCTVVRPPVSSWTSVVVQETACAAPSSIGNPWDATRSLDRRSSNPERDMPLRMSLPRPGEPSCPGMTNHTETLFPKRAIETSPDAKPIIGPRPSPRGGTLPADQANPISVVSTLQRISRSRKGVIAMRPKDVEAVPSHRGKAPFSGEVARGSGRWRAAERVPPRGVLSHNRPSWRGKIRSWGLTTA